MRALIIVATMALMAATAALAMVPAAVHAEQPQDFGAPGSAAVQGLNLITEQAIHAAVEGFVHAELDGNIDPDERFEVSVRWQGDVLLDAPVGRIEFRVKPVSTGGLRGPTVVRVEIVVDEVTERALTLTADVRFYRDVLVTTRAIRRHASMEAGMVELVERDVTSLRFGYFEDHGDLVGLQARRPIGFGDILNEEHVELIPVVRRGEGVIMTAVSLNMEISTTGLALQDGGIGEQIRVKNLDSGKTIMGRVLEAGSVRIGL